MTENQKTHLMGSHELAAKYTPIPDVLRKRLLGEDYQLPDFGAIIPDSLSGYRIALITTHGPELPEFDVPVSFLRESGAEVDVITQEWLFDYVPEAPGQVVLAQWLAVEVCVTADIKISDANIEDYDAVIIIGGAWNPIMLRTDEKVLTFIREAHRLGKLIASICHGPQVLISARTFPAGTRATGVDDIKIDLANAGFMVSDDPVVYDRQQRLITSRDPRTLKEFCEAIREKLLERSPVSSDGTPVLPKFHLSSTPSGRFSWHFSLDSENSLANGGQPYQDKTKALQDIQSVRDFAAGASVVDLTDGQGPLSGEAGFELYQDRNNKYRWRMKSASGEIIAVSSPAYTQQADIQTAIEYLQEHAAAAELVDETSTTGEDHPYDLGVLPSGMNINWPAKPAVTQEIIIDAPLANNFLDQPQTRYHVQVNLPGLTIATSDIELQVDEGVKIDSLLISRSQKRIRITGGEFGRIDFDVPAGEYREEFFIEDVCIENVRVISPNSSAFEIRVKRLAILNSRAQARHYCIWAGGTGLFNSEDIIIAGNKFESFNPNPVPANNNNPEATIRLVDCLRTVVVDNHLSNLSEDPKHNYRVHGRSDSAFAARNTLCRTGAMLGNKPPEDTAVGRVWFIDNAIHYDASNSPLVLDNLRAFIARNNKLYTAQDPGCFVCHGQSALPAGWVDENNIIHPYQACPPE